MTAPLLPLLRYQSALLLRSHRWLPPVIVYAAYLVIGVQTGGPILDSYGYAAAPLLPVTAWLVRAAVTNEPSAARNCAAAAAGPARAHLASVLAGALAGTVLALAGTAYVALLADPHASDHRTPVPVLPATGAGLLAALACVLLGVAVGALCNRPILRSPAQAIPAGLLAALFLLVLAPSPANAAVTGLVTGSSTGTITLPWLPLIATAAIATTAVALACALDSRRT